jgi:carbamoyltransferase
VLENLNTFLKQRESFRAYGLSVCIEDAPQYFSGRAPSRFMELEYEVLDRTRFRHVLPDGVRRLRVQTIEEQPALFRQLHRAFGKATGVGVLVNTSFNGFHEPMVCCPRDAVRVFYGGGLDMAILGGFVLRK